MRNESSGKKGRKREKEKTAFLVVGSVRFGSCGRASVEWQLVEDSFSSTPPQSTVKDVVF